MGHTCRAGEEPHSTDGKEVVDVQLSLMTD